MPASIACFSRRAAAEPTRLPAVFLAAFLAAVAFAPSPAPAALVKQSSSGICHAPDSPWYGRTKTFEAFDSLADCLKSGRLPKGYAPSSGAAPASSRGGGSHAGAGYDRDRFGDWRDADGDCLNTRHELLAATSAGAVRRSGDGCRITTGAWAGLYTGRTYRSSSDLDIDHVVPLKWAWDHGADAWPPARRARFANDYENLHPVQSSANRSKSADGPLDWLPPDRAAHCHYVRHFRRVVDAYDLTLNAGERRGFDRLLRAKCG